MKLLKHSCLLILSVLVLVLSVPSTSTNANSDQLKNPVPSPNKASKPPESKPASSTEQAKSKQSTSSQQPIVVNVLPPTKTKEESDREAKAQEEKSSTDRWIVIFSGLLTVFTLLLVGIGWYQGRQNRKAANAALIAAQSSIASERAYVFAKVQMRGQIIADPNRNCTTVMDVVFVNHGKTPAIILHMSGHQYVSIDAPQQLLTALHSGPELPDGLVIAGGNGYQYEMGLRITTDELTQIERGVIRLYVAGVIRYRDILGNDRETGYCWEYMPAAHDRRFRFCEASRLNYYT